MERVIIGVCAALTAVIPFFFVVWTHTSSADRFVSEWTDVYYPGGPTKTFSDFSPGSRTGQLTSDGRPITDSPVYLLFQPRRHSRFVRVEIEGKTDINQMGLNIGYRDGDGPDHNIFNGAANEMRFLDGGWNVWIAELPLSDMVPEHIDARRIVVEALSHNATSTPVVVRRVKVFYEDKK